jgi:hypothetical protein
MIELPATTLLAKNAAYAYLRLACPVPLFDSLVRLFDGDSSRVLRELSSRWSAVLERLEVDTHDGTLREFTTTQSRYREQPNRLLQDQGRQSNAAKSAQAPPDQGQLPGCAL